MSEEEHKLLHQWNDTARDYPLDRCLHWFIEEQVEKTPRAKALTCEGNSLSYEELNNRANQLARCLQSKGVGPETLVGVCAFRSMEMVSDRISLSVKFDYRKGVSGALESKIKSVEEKGGRPFRS